MITFYILQNQTAAGLFTFVCKFLEKIYKQNHTALVQLANNADAATLDQLLWTYDDNSFIPHALSHEPEAKTAPIILGHGEPHPHNHDVFVNLTADIFEINSKRIVEIVPNQDPWLTQSRQKFVRYRELGFEIKTHKI